MSSRLIDEKLIDEISSRRTHVLQKFSDFEKAAEQKRECLLQACQLQEFNRGANEVEQNIEELIEKLEKIVVKHNLDQLNKCTKLLDRLKESVFGIEPTVRAVEAFSARLVAINHYAKQEIEETTSKIRQRFEHLLSLLSEKQAVFKKEQDSLEFCRKCELLLEWIGSQKGVEWAAGNTRQLFDEIRKKSIIWNEILSQFRDISEPTIEENAIFDKVKEEWTKFQVFVDDMMKEMDENERIEQLLENSKEMRNWMNEKQMEMEEKYGKMGVKDGMKYRKAVEIEMRMTRQRVEELGEKIKDDNNNNDVLDKDIEETAERLRQFEIFFEKWMENLEDREDIEKFMKEAEEVLYWCSEKMEDLRSQEISESSNCDEIAVWIETNRFDFNSWDVTVENLSRSAEKLINRNIEVEKVKKHFDDVQNAYEKTKNIAEDVNKSLEDKIEMMFIEEQIFQIHAKASHLVSLVNTDWKYEHCEQVEKMVTMIDGLVPRCASVVEQIESVEMDAKIGRLSKNAEKMLKELLKIKENLKTACSTQKLRLQQKLDIFYNLDSSEELKKETQTMIHNLKTEIHREARLKSSKNRISPIREQLEKIVNEFEYLLPVLEGMEDREWSGTMENRIRRNIEEIERNIESLVREHEAQLEEYDVKRHVDNTDKFVQRVERFMEDAFNKSEEDETDSPLRNQNLRRIISNCKQLISIGEGYKEAVGKRKNDVDNTSNEAMCLLDEVERQLNTFLDSIGQKIDKTEELIEDSEQMAELNSHNDWIKGKIEFLSKDPNFDSLLSVQKLLRRYENDSEEIENRRRSVNDIIMDVKKVGRVTRPHMQMIDEIERNWTEMKELFDDRGMILERMVLLFQYDEESATIWEWIRQKHIFVDSIERKDDEELNRVMLKKLEDLKSEMDIFEPKVDEIHKLLEDALIYSKPMQTTGTIQRFKSDLTKKQGDVESEFLTLKRMVLKKIGQLKQLLQEFELVREVAGIEKWIEEQESVLNRLLNVAVLDENEVMAKLDDVEMNLNRKRANLTDIKCENLKDGNGSQKDVQRIDETFSMLEVFSFELDRMRQKVGRSTVFKNLKQEMDDIIDSIQVNCQKLEIPTTREVEDRDFELETLRKRVLNCLAKAKDVRSANADLATAVYELEEKLEKYWIGLVKMADEHKKEIDERKMLKEIEMEVVELEQWVDTLNEEIAIVMGSIHDGLGVQIGLESIDTWREELSRRDTQLQTTKTTLNRLGNSHSDGLSDKRSRLVERVNEVEQDVGKAHKTIEEKNEFLLDFLDILHAERNCDRLISWIGAKKKVLDDDLNNNQNVKEVARKMGEIEKMMMNRMPELDELTRFVESLKNKPTTFERTEVEEKFEILNDEWKQLEEDLRRREVDFNESMSQLACDEEFEQIQNWIDRKIETISDDNDGLNLKSTNFEKKQKQYDTVESEIRDYQPVFEGFLRNVMLDEEKIRIIQTKWEMLIERTTITRRRLDDKIEKNRVLELLENVASWLNDAQIDVRNINLENLYKTTDAEKNLRKLSGIRETANDKEHLLKSVKFTAPNILGDEKERVENAMHHLENEIIDFKNEIKMMKEDLIMWKDLQEVAKMIDDEICWFKEYGVLVSSSDVGQDIGSIDVIDRKHQRFCHELEKRKQKTLRVIDQATEVLSNGARPTLDQKINEIGEKTAQMENLIENVVQLTAIRGQRIQKWRKYFELLDEVKEKEQVLGQIGEVVERWICDDRYGERMLMEIERKMKVVETIWGSLNGFENRAEQLTNDEMIRTKGATNAVQKLEASLNDISKRLDDRHTMIHDRIEHDKFLWKCDLALQCIGDQEEKISNIIRQKRTASSFEKSQYESTINFVEKYSRDTVEKLIETSQKLKNSDGIEERQRKVQTVAEKMRNLKTILGHLEEKLESDGKMRERVQKLQEEYVKAAIELANWIEQAEEDVSDLVWFQTKESTEECLTVLLDIMDLLKNEKSEILGELELIEVEMAEFGEDVTDVTWHSFRTLSAKMSRLAETIKDRTRIGENEIGRHVENEKICREAGELLQKCKNVVISTKKELDRLPNFGLDEQAEKLGEFIRKLRGSGMIVELEELRELMESRYIFDNKFSKLTPHGVLVEISHCLELMSSMLRSVEHSIADRNFSGVSDKQLKEFENAFDYFDKGKTGWLDYENFELCVKSQGYNFVIDEQTPDAMLFLDAKRSGRVLKTDYMRWMIKNESTNVFDDQQAIQEALKSLDAKKLSDSMSRKEADFFMRKIAHHTETVTTEHVHLEYKDFVKSFY